MSDNEYNPYFHRFSEGEYLVIDNTSTFYKNCVRQRKRNSKICNDCPFKEIMDNADSYNKKQK